MTLGVYAAYRGRCVGTQLLRSVLEYVEDERNKQRRADVDDIDIIGNNNDSNTMDDSGSSLLLKKKHHTHTTIDEIYLHVQTNNVDAMQFYKKFGFEIGDKIVGYYRRIDPPDCYVIFKRFTRDDNDDESS